MPPVRNVSNIGGIPIHVFVPPAFSPIYKIIVSSTSIGIDYDVTNLVIDGSYTDGVTETIGSFNLVIDNSAQQYSNLFNLYDRVKIYLDYGTTATTLVFIGLIERPSNVNNTIQVSGRGAALRVIGKSINYSATSTARSDVLIDIINTFFSGVISTSGIETDSELITVSYTERPFWDIVQELCRAGGRDAYINSSFVMQYFVSGSRLNETEALVHDANIISTSDFSPDLTTVYNTVKVYGASLAGLPVFAVETSASALMLTTNDVKALVINDSSILTVAQAQARAEFELQNAENPLLVGTVKGLMLPTLLPGEQLQISDPLNNLPPTYYQVQQFTHFFSNDSPPQTEVTIAKERVSIPTLLKKRIKFESEIPETNNVLDMTTSYIINFVNSSGTNSNTTITQISATEGVLRVTTGQSSGTWTSDSISLPTGITDLSLRFAGDSLSGTTVSVSFDSGVSYSVVSGSSSITLSGSPTSIRIRLSLTNTATNVKAIGLYYK